MKQQHPTYEWERNIPFPETNGKFAPENRTFASKRKGERLVNHLFFRCKLAVSFREGILIQPMANL